MTTPSQEGRYRRFLRRVKESSPEDYDRLTAGLALAAAVWAFSTQGITRFFSPQGVVLSGFIVATTLVAATIYRVFGSRPAGAVFQLLTMAGGLFGFGFATLIGMSEARWNDQRCMRLQAAMLRPTAETRTDIVDVWQALGCQPHGSEPRDPAFRPVRGGPPPSMEAIAAHERLIAHALERELAVDRPDIQARSPQHTDSSGAAAPQPGATPTHKAGDAKALPASTTR